MVELAMTWPVPFTERREFASPVKAKVVVVAFVEVAFWAVKFWSVVEPDKRRLEREVSPPVAVKVPVKLAAEDIVCEFMSPEVIVPEVKLPNTEVPEVRLVEKRLVDDAVVE